MQYLKYLGIALIIVVLIIGGFFAGVQYQNQKSDVNKLPYCEYNMVSDIQGIHTGYWVGTVNQKEVCVTRFDNRTNIVDLGL